jgi:hypothetical protein
MGFNAPTPVPEYLQLTDLTSTSTLTLGQISRGYSVYTFTCYVNITDVTDGEIASVSLSFVDYTETTQTIFFEVVGDTTFDLKTVKYFVFPSILLATDGSTDFTLTVTLSGTGTMKYDVGASLVVVQ